MIHCFFVKMNLIYLPGFPKNCSGKVATELIYHCCRTNYASRILSKNRRMIYDWKKTLLYTNFRMIF
jgi:hypothetical protein